MKPALSPVQRRVYLEHGAALHKYPVSLVPFSRTLGVTRHTLLAVQEYVNTYGPPSDEDYPGAIHLVIPDAHAKPGTDQSRFTILGREIEEAGREAYELGVPFRVVSIGDFADMPSLSYYDRGKASGEARRYPLDIAATKEAVSLMRDACSPEIWSYADKWWTEGNHEYRATRYMNDNPELQGVLQDPYFVMSDAGFEPVEFCKLIELDGVGYVHYMQNPGSGKAVSGVNHARSLVLKGYRSLVVGHSHKLDTYTTADVYGNPIQTLVCGCYFEHNEEYAGQSNQRWWRGLHVLRNVKNGSFNLESRSLKALRLKHGVSGV